MTATLPSSSLSRTRSTRVPGGRPVLKEVPAMAHPKSNGLLPSPTSTHAQPGPHASTPSTLVPTTHIGTFLTNLRLLALDTRDDWPGMSARTFAARDAAQGLKTRIQAAEWALYQLFCLWDAGSDDARKMHALWPPADQVQSVALRAALLRGLEGLKRSGALGRDAAGLLLRKTMLDECRGERFEEVLAVFSSAVLRRVLQAEHDRSRHNAAALTLALEPRGYDADRTQLNALLLAHKASLAQKLRHRAVARARYRDFAELLALKARQLARRREQQTQRARHADDEHRQSVQSVQSVQPLSDDARMQVQRLVRNNWAGSEPWLETLLYGDANTHTDCLLATDPGRVWRRVQAGRLDELEGGSTDRRGLLAQLEARVVSQKQRCQRWNEYSQRILGRPVSSAPEVTTKTTKVTTTTTTTTQTGIDLGFGAHSKLYPPVLSSPRKGTRQQRPQPPHDDYDGLLASFWAELARATQPATAATTPLVATPLVSYLQGRAATKKTKKPDVGASSDEAEFDESGIGSASDISDLDEHEHEHEHVSNVGEHAALSQTSLAQQQRQFSPRPLHAHAALSLGAASEDSSSPTRRRVLLSKSSTTFSVHSFQSDDEPEPVLPTAKTTKTGRLEHPLPPAVRKLSGQGLADRGDTDRGLPFRTRTQSPPIRAPRLRHTPPPQTPPQLPPPPPPPRTPSPDRSPPPPSPTPPEKEHEPFTDDYGTPHSIHIHPPEPQSGSVGSPAQDTGDQTTMDAASPTPAKRPRHRLSLAQRTRMSMGVWDDEADDDDASGPGPGPDTAQPEPRMSASRDAHSVRDRAAGYEDLVARTRRSMAGLEASRHKAQVERRRSQRLRPPAVPAAPVAPVAAVAPAASAQSFGSIDEDPSVLADELIGQDDAEAIFRSRPKIKMSPIPSPTREMDF